MTEILRNRRGDVKLSASRIAGYATAASAAALAGVAEGAITYSGPLNIAVADLAVGGGFTGLNLTFGSTPHNLLLGHGLGATNAATGYAITGQQFAAVPGVEVAGFTAAGYNYVTNVALGAAISALPTFLGAAVNATMAFNTGYGNDQFLAAAVGFIGVRFNTNQYGWVRVQMDGAPLNSFTVIDYAYADAGEAITAGQVPTPGALGALALGAAGLVGMRRRKVG